MMALPSPLVSVAVVTYNHERFIEACLQSILGQTFADIEVVVVDDGSSDGTHRAIGAIRDPRLVALRQDNQGPSAALNCALAACRGQFIALMSGDDVCQPRRIETQLNAHRQVGGVIFSNVDYIDDDGRPIENGLHPKGFFESPPRSQAEILRQFFTGANFLAAPTCFLRADDLRAAGPFDPLLYQLQDLDMWVRLVKRHRFTILPQPLVHYRFRGDGANLSAPAANKIVRTQNETYLILRRFFESMPADLFRETFAEQWLAHGEHSPAEMECERAFLYLKHPTPLARLIGVEKLHALLNDREAATILRTRFRYSQTDLTKFLLQFNPRRELDGQTRLYIDTGEGFNASQVRAAPINCSGDTFSFTFDVSDFAAIKRLRWDPVEFQLCRVRIAEASWDDRAGARHQLDLAGLSANGARGGDGTFTFDTLDPNIYLPIAGDVCSLTLLGSWQLTDHYSSTARAHELLTIAKLERDALAFEKGCLHQELEHRERDLLQRAEELESVTQELRNIRQSRTWRWGTALKSLLRGAVGRRH
jgi:glycosyltransferase involved in cell wall biosynthesis